LEQDAGLHAQKYLARESGEALDAPQDHVDWYMAAYYCNWLSQREGIPRDQWCFEPNDKGQFGEGMRVAPDYSRRMGYRRPPEPEWEYACRGGTTTARFFGESAELLRRYACCAVNSEDHKVPVGTFRPNPFGLFDIYGNVFEFCLDASRDNAAGASIGVG